MNDQNVTTTTINSGYSTVNALREKSSRRTSSLRFVFKFIFAILTLFVLIICAIFWLNIWIVRQRHEYDSLCLTRQCIKIASTILERVDPTIDPCSDFYQFSCGNFIRTNTAPDDYYASCLLQEIQESTFVEMKHNLESAHSKNETNHIRQIKQLYQSCMNETDEDLLIGTSIESLFDLIIELTGNEWPLLSANEITAFERMSFERQLALLFLYQVQPFFQVFVAPHKNTSTYALHIFPAATVMELLNFGISKNSDNLTEAQIELYHNFQRDVLKTFLLYKGEDNMKERFHDIEKELKAMLRLEMQLGNITKDAGFENGNCTIGSVATNGTEFFDTIESDCDDRLGMNPHLFVNISIDEMEREFSQFKWKQFFRFALEDQANVTLSHVLIHSKEYFHTLLSILEKSEPRTVINYLCWNIVTKYMPYLGPQFKHLTSELQQKILISDTDISDAGSSFKYYQMRWKQCVYIACEGLKIPSIALYLERHRDNLTENANQIVALIEEMKETFLRIIDAQSWIDSPQVKQVLKRRVSEIRSNIGVPEYLRNESMIQQMYVDLQIDPSKDLIVNIFKINKHETILEVKKLQSSVSAGGEWLFQPLETNAFYDFTSNDIIMPIGIVRSPMVLENIPKYLQLSFLGIVIGHEIAHSIDMNSRKHITEKSDLLTNSSFSLQFKNKANCFSEKYSSFMVDEMNQNLNGNHTLEENICDFASFQTAFSIYKSIDDADNLRLPGLSRYSTDQIFFIQYAQLWCEVATKDGHIKSLQDNHSPGKFRANGVVMNSKAFADTFYCAPDSKMNPPDKCDLWTYGY